MYYGGSTVGAQCQHGIAELFTKYPIGSNESNEVMDWAVNYKTVVNIRGGGHNDMLELENEFGGMKIPFSSFVEQSNNNSMSVISFVMDSWHVDIMEKIRKEKLGELDIIRIAEQENVYLKCSPVILMYIATRPLVN